MTTPSNNIITLCPSRGRGQALLECGNSHRSTVADDEESYLIPLIDSDDPQLCTYQSIHPNTRVQFQPGSMAEALNRGLATMKWGQPGFPWPTMIGFCGDDHRFRKWRWSTRVLTVNTEISGGIVYGNDLFQGERLATAVFIDSRIIQALGWMALPGAKHLWLDSAWMTLGRTLGRLKYLPDVIIEHMHPAAGKGTDDAGYARVNSPETRNHDERAYHKWCAEQLVSDVEKCRKALGIDGELG